MCVVTRSLHGCTLSTTAATILRALGGTRYHKLRTQQAGYEKVGTETQSPSSARVVVIKKMKNLA